MALRGADSVLRGAGGGSRACGGGEGCGGERFEAEALFVVVVDDLGEFFEGYV